MDTILAEFGIQKTAKIVCFEVFSKPQTGSNASERLCEERMLDLKQVL